MSRAVPDGAPPTSPLEPTHLSLARDLLGRGLPWRYREVSTSMVPTIQPYDVVEVRPAGVAELRQGDVLAVLRPEGLLLHRLVRIERGGGEELLILRGDARAACDPPQPASRLLGRVTLVERGGRPRHVGRRRPGPLLRRLQRLLGLLRP